MPCLSARLLAVALISGCSATVRVAPPDEGRGAAPPATPAPAPTATPAAPAPTAAPAPAAVLAVFDLEDGSGGLVPTERTQLGDYLAVRVATLPGVRVVPRDRLREALAEAKAEGYRACFDQSCQLELGKALSAQKTLATKLLRVGSSCALTGALFDLRTETTDRAASVRTPCRADALLAAADELVVQLGGEARAPTPERRAPGPTEVPRATMTAEAPPLELTLDERAPSEAAEPAKAAATPKVTDSPRPAPRPAEARWIQRRGLRVFAGAPVRFAEGDDALDDAAQRALATAAAAAQPEAERVRQRVEVVGHAAIGERGPLELSERRARAAREHLRRLGYPVSEWVVVAAGTADPVGGDRGQQRCVELRLAPRER